jgi:hypothetical protein
MPAKLTDSMFGYTEINLLFSQLMNKNFMWNIPVGVSVINNLKIPSHNQHTFMNIFIKGRLVSAPGWGHHQVILIQESEYMQKLETIKREISLAHQVTLKTYSKIAK